MTEKRASNLNNLCDITVILPAQSLRDICHACNAHTQKMGPLFFGTLAKFSRENKEKKSDLLKFVIKRALFKLMEATLIPKQES